MKKQRNTERARSLRRNMTLEERMFWNVLRTKRFNGFKFRRQEPIGPFIVDFVCFDRKLVIELDGGYHAKTKDYDESRSQWLESQGFRVLRFWNDDIHERLDYVKETVRRELFHEVSQE